MREICPFIGQHTRNEFRFIAFQPIFGDSQKTKGTEHAETSHQGRSEREGARSINPDLETTSERTATGTASTHDLSFGAGKLQWVLST
jgi:hypothetical protein